eukprot:5481039-Amphidinium_carterae.1
MAARRALCLSCHLQQALAGTDEQSPSSPVEREVVLSPHAALNRVNQLLVKSKMLPTGLVSAYHCASTAPPILIPRMGGMVIDSHLFHAFPSVDLQIGQIVWERTRHRSRLSHLLEEAALFVQHLRIYFSILALLLQCTVRLLRSR